MFSAGSSLIGFLLILQFRQLGNGVKIKQIKTIEYNPKHMATL